VNLVWAAVAGLVWLIVATIGGILFGFAAHDAQREQERQMEREWGRQWGPGGERE
jgi:hypothetical protein